MRRARTQAAALRLIWLPGDVLDKLSRLRGAAESYSDVILRLAAEASDSGRRDPCVATKVKTRPT
jgi:hypothetical protein